jgi:hypothetical protein
MRLTPHRNLLGIVAALRAEIDWQKKNGAHPA